MDATILVAGTFDVLHAGHYLLLHAAFHSARAVEVWLSDDAMCAAKALRCGQALQPLASRAAALRAWLEQQTPHSIAAFYASAGLPLPQPQPPSAGSEEAPPPPPLPQQPPQHPYAGRYSLHALPDALGPAATEPRYTAIVCSEETRQGCEAINAQRCAGGLAPLRLVVVPLLLGQGGEKLSSTAARAAAAAAAAAVAAPRDGAAQATAGGAEDRGAE